MSVELCSNTGPVRGLGALALSAYRPAADLPPGIQPLDLTVSEVMAVRRESAATVFRKIRDGRYRSYKSGDSRLIELASVLADRDACLARGPQLVELTGKRGRPKKVAAPAGAGHD